MHRGLQTPLVGVQVDVPGGGDVHGRGEVQRQISELVTGPDVLDKVPVGVHGAQDRPSGGGCDWEPPPTSPLKNTKNHDAKDAQVLHFGVVTHRPELHARATRTWSSVTSEPPSSVRSRRMAMRMVRTMGVHGAWVTRAPRAKAFRSPQAGPFWVSTGLRQSGCRRTLPGHR